MEQSASCCAPMQSLLSLASIWLSANGVTAVESTAMGCKGCGVDIVIAFNGCADMFSGKTH